MYAVPRPSFEVLFNKKSVSSHINGYYKNYKGGVFDSKQWTYPQAEASTACPTGN